MEEKARDGVFCVVTPEQLEVATRNGWKLCDHYEIDAPIDVVDETVDPYNGTRPTRTIRRERGKARRFLVMMDETGALKLKSDEVERAHERCRMMSEQQQGAVKEAEALRKQVVSQQMEISNYKAANNTLDERIKKLLEVQRKMELTLGRLRERLGTERFAELSK